LFRSGSKTARVGNRERLRSQTPQDLPWTYVGPADCARLRRVQRTGIRRGAKGEVRRHEASHACPVMGILEARGGLLQARGTLGTRRGSRRWRRHEAAMHIALEVLAVILAAVTMSLALAHALELPGKLRLSKEHYLAVQAIYYPGFTIAGIAEVGSIIAALFF
jgi:hypothetical protein